MNKYSITTVIDACQVIYKNPESIAEIARLLPNIPHYFTNDGLCIPNIETGEEDIISYGEYIGFDSDGQLLVFKQKEFEERAVKVQDIHYSSTSGST